MALRSDGYSGNSFLYHLWLDKALGNKLATVQKKKTKPAKLQVIIAQPSHSIISPR